MKNSTDDEKTGGHFNGLGFDVDNEGYAKTTANTAQDTGPKIKVGQRYKDSMFEIYTVVAILGPLIATTYKRIGSLESIVKWNLISEFKMFIEHGELKLVE